ncbi:MAG: hypothetical protein KH847_10850, partial [Clostridiales bacterium]|nr:hypothetical protein [Clostridiales bacterium]
MAQKKFKGKKKGDGRETLSLQDLAKAPHEDYKKEDREKGIPARIVSLSRTFAFAVSCRYRIHFQCSLKDERLYFHVDYETLLV